MLAPLESIEVTVNGVARRLAAAPGRRLSDVLREDAGQLDVKVGCDAGDCGACTVLLDGAPVCACLTPAAQAAGRKVTTVAGLGQNRLSGLQQAFLRHGAAQCGICTPGMLIAASALLAEAPRPTRAQVETALGGVLCRCTGYAKIVAAVLDASDPPPPPALPLQGQAVGAAAERLDGAQKVDGREKFGADAWPGGALWARAVRSPHHAATFEFGDVANWAAAHPGVAAVFTAADIPGRNRFGVIPELADQPALADGRTRFKGEAVALVVGDRDLVDALDLTDFPVAWTPADALLTPQHALAAQELHIDRPRNILVEGRVVTGDADAALAASAHVVEASFETGFVEHAPIEPEAGVAWMQDGVLVVQACTQAPGMDRADLSALLDLPPERVRIVPTAAGGGFGTKLDLSVQPLIGLAALKTGRPCRMTYSRSESMAATTKRHPGQMVGKLGADADGRIVAMTFAGDFDTGAYASWGPTVANRVPVHASGPYRTPNYRATSRAIHTNNPVAGAFRGFGVPQATILQELLYDRMATALDIDRLEFRIRNALQDGDRTPTGQMLQSVGILECLEALRPHWAAALARIDRADGDPGEVRRGVGVASCWYGCGNTSLPNPSTIRMGVDPAGQVWLHQGAVDIGQGSNTVIAQIAADGLGAPLAALKLIGADTARTPEAGKTSASRQTFVTGNAALRAGQALRAKLLRLANMGDGATLRFGGDGVAVTEDGRSAKLDLAAMTPDDAGYAVAVEATYDPPTTPLDADGQGEPYAVYGYGAQLAEVSVDMALGLVKVRRVVAAHDLGRAINPLLAEGQIEGGVAQGLGLALMEEYLPGRTENLHDYLIPTVGDMPEIETILVEKPDPAGPMGARGLGEHVLIPTAPAILNAIRHATGAELDRAPALPHRVRAAILRKEKGQ